MCQLRIIEASEMACVVVALLSRAEERPEGGARSDRVDSAQKFGC